MPLQIHWDAIRVSTQSYLWGGKFSRRFGGNSNSQPFDHESGALTNTLSLRPYNVTVTFLTQLCAWVSLSTKANKKQQKTGMTHITITLFKSLMTRQSRGLVQETNCGLKLETRNCLKPERGVGGGVQTERHSFEMQVIDIDYWWWWWWY